MHHVSMISTEIFKVLKIHHISVYINKIAKDYLSYSKPVDFRGPLGCGASACVLSVLIPPPYNLLNFTLTKVSQAETKGGNLSASHT